jgi:hypothetical protein
LASPPQTDRPEPPIPADRIPPGSFVNGEMQEECARFLAEVRSLVHRRSERQRQLLRNVAR